MISGDVINEARDHHESFEPERLPDSMVLRRLTSIESTLLQRVVQTAEETLATQIEFTAEDLAEGSVELPPHLVLFGLFTRGVGGWSRSVPIVPESQADQYHRGHRQAFVRGNLLFLVGSPTEGESLFVTYVPAPVPLEALDQELVLPDEARPAVVAQLALWMAGRRGVLKELPHLPGQAEVDTSTFLQTMSERSHTSDWRVRRG